MKRFMAGLITGCLLTVLLLAIAIYASQQRIQAKLVEIAGEGGRLNGLLEAVTAIEKEFGEWDGKAEYKQLFWVKSSSVVVIETNGVKTLRVMQ